MAVLSGNAVAQRQSVFGFGNQTHQQMSMAGVLGRVALHDLERALKWSESAPHARASPPGGRCIAPGCCRRSGLMERRIEQTMKAAESQRGSRMHSGQDHLLQMIAAIAPYDMTRARQLFDQ